MNTEHLRQTTILADLPEPDLESLAAAFQREVFPPGTILFREGEEGNRFAVVLRGEIEIIKALGTSDERLLARIGPGEYLGDMSLVDPGGRRSASARAHGTMEWAELAREDFIRLIEGHPPLALRLLQEINSRLRRSEAATVMDLRRMNQALSEAFDDLQQAQAALVENKTLEHELEIARTIQKSILPTQLPDLQGWQIATHWQPARGISGDFYDLLPYPDGSLGLLIADVSGKGIPAALVMAATCSLVRAVVPSETNPGKVLEKVNHLLCQNMPPRMFVTCLYGRLDPASRELRFANAGHNLPIKISRSGAEELLATGMPLGLLPGMSYEEKEARFETGDHLFCYTDGIIEAHNEQNEMFGAARVQENLARASVGTPTIDSLLARLAEFTGPDWRQEDDITVLAMTCLEE